MRKPKRGFGISEFQIGDNRAQTAAAVAKGLVVRHVEMAAVDEGVGDQGTDEVSWEIAAAAGKDDVLIGGVDGAGELAIARQAEFGAGGGVQTPIVEASG